MPDSLRKIDQLRRLCNARRTVRSSTDRIARPHVQTLHLQILHLQILHLQTLGQAAPLRRSLAARLSSFERK